MNFNQHSNLLGHHAFLSASKYHWINYDDEKLVATFLTSMAAKKGTELHAFAHHAISLGIKLPRTNKSLNAYVNDAIGFRMTPEQPLFYSPNCFGTVDSISFRKNLLRVHDFKSGETKVSMKQLEVYAALFCLEYGNVFKFRPGEIEMELRIYQSDEIIQHYPEVDAIAHIMDKIIRFDKKIEEIKLKEL